jgi:RNA polymerase sigma-70 factor, ECF subfamily
MSDLATAAHLGPTRTDAASARTDVLHGQYSKAVFGYCLRRLRSREEAEDAAQIVFLTAHRCFAEGVRPRSDGAWLFKIAEHVVLYRRRTISRRARVEFPVDIDDVAHLAVTAGEDVQPEILGLSEALSGLSGLQRRALVLREWHGLSYREVAEELGVSHSTVETLIFRGRRSLAERLSAPERDSGKRRRLGLCSPWLSLKGALGGGVVMKTVVAGAVSVAVVTATVEHALPRTSVPASAAAAFARSAPVQTAAPARPRHRGGIAALGRPAAGFVSSRTGATTVGLPPVPAIGTVMSSASADPKETQAPAPVGDPASSPPPLPQAFETQAVVATAPPAHTDGGVSAVGTETGRKTAKVPHGRPSFAHGTPTVLEADPAETVGALAATEARAGATATENVSVATTDRLDAETGTPSSAAPGASPVDQVGRGGHADSSTGKACGHTQDSHGPTADPAESVY